MSATSASAETWNHRNSKLKFPAGPGFKQQCKKKGRVLELNGRYVWTTFAGRADQPGPDELVTRSRTERHVFRGTYKMIDCLYPDTTSDGKFAYRHESRVVNLDTGGQWMMGTDGKEQPEDFLVQGPGKYHWGSTIENVRNLRKNR